MLDNDLQEKVDELINQIVSYWGNNVSVINIITHERAPFDIFEIYILLYSRFEVMVEYEGSTIGFRVKVGDEYIGLSRLMKM